MEKFFDKSEERDMTFKVGDLKDVFKDPNVAAIPELEGLPQKTIKYLAYCYDLNSPLVKKSRDLMERKEKSAKVAAVPKEEWDSLMSLNSDSIVNAIIAMLRYQMSHVWDLIVMHEESFEEIKRRVLAPVDDEKDKNEIEALEKKNKLLQIADEIYKRLNQYKSTLYTGDKELEEKVERIRFTPESIAKHV